MNIKKNKHGFTLVELVVVVCIFGIILSAILNFMKPANEIHNDTQATMDANVISSGLIEYVDDELRYATNILVLKDYLGVPAVSADGRVGSYDVEFSNCLVIDNCNPRGYSDTDYNPDADDTATKMKARGSIIKVSKLNSEGFNFKNSQIVKGKSFYDKFTFTIEIGSNVLDKAFEKDHSRSTLEISLKAYQPVYQNGEFVFTKKKFDRDTNNGEDGTIEKNRGAVLNLTNIDLSASQESKSSKLEVVDVADTNPTQVIGLFDGKGYPTATAPAGATSYQAEYYNAVRTINFADTNGEKKDVVPRYTYIFYQKNKSATQCKVSFKYASDSPFTPDADVSAPETVKKGTTFKNFPVIPAAPTGYNPGVWRGPDGSTVDPSAGFKIEGDVTFRIQYTEKAPSPNEVTLTWLRPDGSPFKTNKQEKALEGEHVSVIKPVEAPVDTEVYDYKWVQQGTGADVDTVNLTGDMTFIAIATAKPVVLFKADGTNIDNKVYATKGEILPTHFVPEVASEKIPSGKMFDCWVLEGDESKNVTNTVISGDCTFVAKFKDKPPVPDGASVVKVHVKKLNGGSNVIAVSPNGGGQLKYSFNSDTIEYTDWKSYDNMLSNGADLEFTFYNTGKDKNGNNVASTMKLQFQWGSAREFSFNGTVTEVWYKDGQFYDSDPG